MKVLPEKGILRMWDAYFHTPGDSELFVGTAYDAKLVVLSVVIAITMAILSLHIVSIAQRSNDRRLRTISILSGALVLGIGVWSMHFIGMLALSVCATVRYDIPMTVISVLPGLLAAWSALRMVMGVRITKRQLFTSGALVGSGIGTMHYVGMQAMQMTPLLRYQPIWFFLSIALAVVFATLSLWINGSGFGRRLGHWTRIIISGGVMGTAISGMHYTAMHAAIFLGSPEFEQPLAPQGTNELTQAITLGMLLLSSCVVGVNVFARYRTLLRLADAAHKEMAVALMALKDSESLLEQRVSERTRSLRQSHADLEAMATNLKAALRDSDALLSTLNMHAIVSVGDRTGTIIEANDAFCTISGYSREELIGRNHRIVNSGTQSRDFWAAMWKTIGSGTPWRGEICNRNKSGTLYWVDTFIAPFVGADGRIEKFVSIRTNITALKDNELELISHRDRLSQLVHLKTADLERTVALSQQTLAELKRQRSVIDEHAIVTICGVDGRITYGNDKFCAVSGYTREEFIGRDHSILNSGYHPKGFFRQMYETIGRGEIWHAEICNRAKDGSLYWVESTTSAFLNENGSPREYIAVHTDVTERKRAEEAAHAASRSKSNFLANMSHEIRTPMNGVIGMVDILMQTELKPEQRRMLGTVHESSLVLLNIINDILDYSKIEAGKLEVEHIPMQLSGVADSVIQLLHSVSSSKAVTLWLEVSPELPPWVLGDPNRLRQVLLNLLGNALKFTNTTPERAGQVSLTLDKVALSNGAPGIRMTIRDNGIGMSEEIVTKLFQPFMQADGSTARKFGGTGLGLSITQRLVELMQGDISVRSTPGVGSEFVVQLPLLAYESVGAIANDRMATTSPLEHIDTPPFAVATEQVIDQLILVAEDNETNRDVIQEQLRLIGYRCEVAPDGEQALKMWQAGWSQGKNRYALLFTDCHMPNLDGFGLTQAIRAGEPTGIHMPIIAITANAMHGEAERCKAHGMDDYLAKPLRLRELSVKLAQWLPRTAQDEIAVGADSSAEGPKKFAVSNEPELLPVWSRQTLVSMVGNDPITHQRLLHKFLKHAVQQIAQISLADEAHDCKEMEDVAHTLKSGARSVGALALGQICHTLELAGSAKDTEACSATVALLKEAFSLFSDRVAETVVG